MLKLDPDQRFGIDQVCQLCETYKKLIGSKPTIDTYLIMDDIIEKLSLLDYENLFCKGYKHKRISRIYFAHKPHEGETEQQRICYIYDMVYWLLLMDKEKVRPLVTLVAYLIKSMLHLAFSPRNLVFLFHSKTLKATLLMQFRKCSTTLRSSEPTAPRIVSQST